MPLSQTPLPICADVLFVSPSTQIRSQTLDAAGGRGKVWGSVHSRSTLGVGIAPGSPAAAWGSPARNSHVSSRGGTLRKPWNVHGSRREAG